MISEKDYEIRENKLLNLLLYMSKDEMVLNSEYKRKDLLEDFMAIYGDNKFRHNYSELYIFINGFDFEVDSLSIMLENLETFKSYVYQYYIYGINSCDNIEIFNCYKSLIKLYDHINLDIHRSIKIKQLTDLSNDLKQITDDVQKKTTNQLIEIKNELNNTKNEYISILGIFASIILSFVTGISFSNSIINKTDDLNPYSFGFGVIISGYILIVMLSILINFVGKVIDRNRNEKKYSVVNINQILRSFIIILLLFSFLWWIDILQYRGQNLVKLLCMNILTTIKSLVLINNS